MYQLNRLRTNHDDIPLCQYLSAWPASLQCASLRAESNMGPYIQMRNPARTPTRLMPMLCSSLTGCPGAAPLVPLGLA